MFAYAEIVHYFELLFTLSSGSNIYFGKLDEVSWSFVEHDHLFTMSMILMVLSWENFRVEVLWDKKNCEISFPSLCNYVEGRVGAFIYLGGQDVD